MNIERQSYRIKKRVHHVNTLNFAKKTAWLDRLKDIGICALDCRIVRVCWKGLHHNFNGAFVDK